MNRIIFCLTFALVSTIAFSQNVDYNKIILPENVSNISFEERLVQIAWRNYPQNKIAQHQIEIAEQDLAKTKWTWLDNIAISGNLNEFTINPNAMKDANGNIGRGFFPRYNISARITLGMFGINPANTKIARENLAIAEEQVNMQKLMIRSEVLTRYRNYVTSRELLRVRNETSEDVYSIYTIAEQRFRNGESTLEEFNRLANMYNNQREAKISAESQYLQNKYALEAILGLKMEEIE